LDVSSPNLGAAFFVWDPAGDAGVGRLVLATDVFMVILF